MDPNIVTMTENDIFYKQDSLQERNEKIMPKSAFSDLSNRLQKRTTGTQRKFAGKPLTSYVPQEKLENFENYTQFANYRASEDVLDRIAPIEIGRGSAGIAINYIKEQEPFSDDGEDLDFPETETFYPTQQYDLEYYSSLPASPGREIGHRRNEFEEEYDVAEELFRRYAYKDVSDFDLDLISSVDETEMNAYTLESEEDDISLMLSE